MTGIDLLQKKCYYCSNDTPPLQSPTVEKYLNLLKCRWETIDGTKIRHEFRFDDFEESMKFANRIARLSKRQSHHPNIHIYFNRVIVDLTTHNIHGLSENDFLMAAKIEAL